MFNCIRTGLHLLFGQVVWTLPPWANHLRNRLSRHPKLSWTLLLSIIILCGIVFAGYSWYLTWPKPKLVTAHITIPPITPAVENAVPSDLNIDFGIDNNGFSNQSVAPLQSIKKVVNKGVTLTPSIPGIWIWQTDSHLVFKPFTDWPAEKEYHIDFQKNFFSHTVKLASLHYVFTTNPFTAKITQFRFYQDPLNPGLREVVATVEFNYPVDTESLKEHVRLQFQALNQNTVKEFKYSISYDKFKRVAYIHSEPLPKLNQPQYIDLMIDQGVRAKGEPAVTSELVKESVLVPDASSYFKIVKIATSIVRNERDQPEQVITLETSIGVKAEDLNSHLQVYLLPKDYPTTAIEPIQKDYQWRNPGEVTDNILTLATNSHLMEIPADQDYAILHSYKINEPAPRFLYIKIDKGLKGFGDYVLTQDYTAIVKVPPYPKEIGFLHKGALLALGGEKKLSLTVRGLPAVEFSVGRVLPDDINHLVTQTSGQFSDPRFLNYSFTRENVSEIFSETQAFDKENLDVLHYTTLDLGKYLVRKANISGSLGLFLLKATGYDPDKDQLLNVSTSRLILITDLGLIVKNNRDGSHDFFVQSITQGTPVSAVKVTVLGKNGLPIISGTTDEAGHLHIPTLEDYVEDQAPAVYLANYKNDVSFIPYNSSDRLLNYSRFDTGGVTTEDEQTSTLTAYLFSDRGIYRPGDTIHIAAIVKNAYAVPAASGLPLEIMISDPRGMIVQDEKVTLNDIGYFSFDFKTHDTTLTGQYSAKIFIVKDNYASNLLGSTSFKLSEFLPDRMRISASFSQQPALGWISPVHLQGRVELMNLYGAPAAHRKISARILLTPQKVIFGAYPDYIFTDPLLDPKKPPKVLIDTLSNTETDEKGHAQTDLKLERFDKATYELTYYVEGFEAAGGRSVTTEIKTLVSPLAYLVGYKPDGDLKFIQQNSARQINFIAINPSLTQVSLSDLTLELFAEHPVTTLVKKPDQTYQYQSIIQTTAVSEQAFSIEKDGTHFTLPTQQLGDFVIVILDKNHTELSKVRYSIVGKSTAPLAKNADLTVKLNQSIFNPQDTIQMEVTAPYTGSGLITIEKDKVYAYKWFKTDTTHSLQNIVIPKDLQGGGYVNLDFVRDWNSPDIFMSPLSYYVTPFTLSHTDQTININLNVNALARPGEPLKIQYQTDKPGKIIIFAVDEGILQVANYKTPQPLDFFFQKRALEVTTQQIVDQILPKFMTDRELSAAGGDEGETETAQYLNPFKRKTDLPVVFWSNILDADQTSREVTYNVPDYFNGTLRVMAVAVASNALGTSEKTSQIRGAFVINPNVPTFVTPNDEFMVTASIANNVKGSGKNAPVNLTFSTSPGLTLLEPVNQMLKINEGEEQIVHLKLRANSLLGSASLTILAKLADQSSQMTSHLSIRPASIYQTSVVSGESERSITVPLDRKLYPEEREVTAAVSTSPLILVTGLKRYLDNFPYGCTEQLVSKAFPLLSMLDLPWLVSDTIQLTTKINATIQMLAERQLSNGGFSYWPAAGDNENNDFASVYAMHFLTEVRAVGIPIPQQMFSNGIRYLKEVASTNIDNLDQARIRAYAIYVLTRNEIVTTNYLTNLQLYLESHEAKRWHHDIINVYLATTYQLLKSYADAEHLLDTYQPKTTDDENFTDFYNRDLATAQYLYLLARHFPDRLPKLGNSLVNSLVESMNTDSINTILSSFSSLALTAYAHAYEIPTHPTIEINEILINGNQKKIAVTDQFYQKVPIDQMANKINFNNNDQQHYFYQVIQTGFDKDPNLIAEQKGIEIYRDYRNAKGQILNTVSLGDEVEVHIQFRALNNRYLSNMVIVDLLPGGFEVVPNSVQTNNIDYIDIREDRILFFGTFSPDATEMTYKIKATNVGKYQIPAISAVSMYNPMLTAHGISGQMVVTDS